MNVCQTRVLRFSAPLIVFEEADPFGGTRVPENKHSVTLPAVVEKIIGSPDPAEPEKAQINIQEGADPLYKEIRIENSLTDENGRKVILKEGEEVEVTVEAQRPDSVQSQHEARVPEKRFLQDKPTKPR